MPAGEVVRISSVNTALRDAFLRWQCRLRQIAVRQNQGRPGSGMCPALKLDSQEETGHIVTVLPRLPEHSATMELRHMARATHDASERRANALKFLAERYYQDFRQFSETLTATFAPCSTGAHQLVHAAACVLVFEQFSQRYELPCMIIELHPGDPLHEATWWHNMLFNPVLQQQCTILGFVPDWTRAIAEPAPLPRP